MQSLYSKVIDNRYEIEREIGAGNMGKIFRAYDRLQGQIVALKQVQLPSNTTSPTDSITTTNYRLALTREFQLLGTLSHPHIIRVLDYGFDIAGQPFYTMEFLRDTRNIVHYTQDKPQAERIKLLLETIQALAYLHRRGIIHCDLKPDNVQIVNGQARILDFGIALASENTNATSLSGTPAYLAPEMLRNRTAPHIESDLYAFGLIAYEVLVGTFPYANDTLPALMRDIVYKVIEPSDIPLEKPLQKIIARMLEKDPLRRYGNARSVATDLQATLPKGYISESLSIRDSYLQAAQFIGRDQELNTLKDALKKIIRRYNNPPQGSAWLIGGESGVGKSRLLEEIRIAALVEGALVLRGQNTAKGSPYQMWRDALTRLLLFTPKNSYDPRPLKDIVPDLERILQTTLTPLDEFDQRERLSHLNGAILDIFHEQTRPIVILLEDLHNAHDSLDLLQQLTQSIAQLPLMVIATFRIDEKPKLPTLFPMMTYLQLEKLNTHEMRDLAVSMLGSIGHDSRLLELLERETNGNAFFIVEVVRELAGRFGGLDQISIKNLPDSVVSGSVSSIIERRLSQIHLDFQPMLRLAAVYDRFIDLELLQAVDDEMDYDAWLFTCADVAILERYEGVWRFTHDRIREAILNVLDENERPRLHRMIADAIEETYPQDESFASRLFYHWQEAGYTRKQGIYAHIAAQHALATAQFNEAHYYYKEALQVCEPSERPSILLGLGDLHFQVGDLPRALHYLKEAQSNLLTSTERVHALLVLSEIFILEGELPKAMDLLNRAYRLNKHENVKGILPRLVTASGVVHLLSGDYQQAQASLDQAIQMSQKTDDQRQRLRACLSMATLKLYQHQPAEGRELIRWVHGKAKQLNDTELTMASVGLFGDFALEDNKPVEAEQHFTQALTMAENIGIILPIPWFLLQIAFARMKLKDMVSATRSINEAIDRAWHLRLLPELVSGLLYHAHLQSYYGKLQAYLPMVNYLQHLSRFNAKNQWVLNKLLKEWAITPQQLEHIPYDPQQYPDLHALVVEILGYDPDTIG